jgi:cytochrome P450
MAQFISRVATHQTEVGGHRFHPGDHVILSIGAANRDPERFPDPDRLDLGRNDGFHLTFAYGVHHCLGAALARLEGQEVFKALTQRFPNLELTEEPVHRDHFVLRGYKAVHVTAR